MLKRIIVLSLLSLLFIQATNGQAQTRGTGNVWDVDSNGSISQLYSSNTWDTTWDIIVPVNTNGSNNLVLFYDREQRTAQFWNFDAQGQLGNQVTNSTWNQWDNIIPFDTNGDGDDELLFYNQDGTGHVWDVFNDGSIQSMSQATGWSRIWDIIVPVEVGNQTLMLFYDRDGQSARFWTFDAQGNLDTNLLDTTWNQWDNIVPFDTDNDGNDELLFYNQDGIGHVWDVFSDGSIQLMSQATGWSRIWDIILPVEVGNQTLMLFYDRDGQSARFWTFDAQGNLDTNLLDTTWNQWDIIVPFDPDRDGNGELLFYNSNSGTPAQTTTTTSSATDTPSSTHVVTFEIDRLRIVDGEEDGTIVSSGSDEAYMLYFLTSYDGTEPVAEVGRGWGVYEVVAGDEFFYTTSGPGQFLHPLTLTISGNERYAITVFMLESEDDDEARRLIQRVTNSDDILIDYVEDRFIDNQSVSTPIDAMNSMIDEIGYWIFGSYDLLGIRGDTYLPSDSVDIASFSDEYIFSGNNLGDAYDYRLEYTITRERVD